MSNVVSIKGIREAPKAERSQMETLLLTADDVNQWKIPPFQRPVRSNEKVRALSDRLRLNGCVVDGIITLGKVGKDPSLYVVDGQHRLHAFVTSAITEIIADVRICSFENMADMADEFVKLNTALVRMRPDDIVRGLEPSIPAIKQLRDACPFVGYDFIRRGTTSPIVSMSAVFRCWLASSSETPAHSGLGGITGIVQQIDTVSAQQLTVFLLAAHKAWSRDVEYARLWSNLNLTMCMWLWRRLVIDTDRKNKRYILMTPRQFHLCMMSLSADRHYLEWLQGRLLGERDRSPCYTRIKTIFSRRLVQDMPKTKVVFPKPAWAS